MTWSTVGDFIALGFTPFTPTTRSEPSVAGEDQSVAKLGVPGGGGGCPSHDDRLGQIGAGLPLVGWKVITVPYDPAVTEAWRAVRDWNGWLINDIWFDPTQVEARSLV